MEFILFWLEIDRIIFIQVDSYLVSIHTCLDFLINLKQSTICKIDFLLNYILYIEVFWNLK